MTGEVCAMLLDAALIAGGGDVGLRTVQRLDSLLRAGAALPAPIPGNLIAARLYAVRGRLDEARAALHRRARWSVIPADYLASYHLEEARLAVAAGDRPAAILAYRRYLALRAAPEPRLEAQIRQVRRELASLVTEPDT
jgi:hypothetical protein